MSTKMLNLLRRLAVAGGMAVLLALPLSACGDGEGDTVGSEAEEGDSNGGGDDDGDDDRDDDDDGDN